MAAVVSTAWALVERRSHTKVEALPEQEHTLCLPWAL